MGAPPPPPAARIQKLTLSQAYAITAACTPKSLDMRFLGQPVYDIEYLLNNFYRIRYPDQTSQIVFSAADQYPVTVMHPPIRYATHRNRSKRSS